MILITISILNLNLQRFSQDTPNRGRLLGSNNHPTKLKIEDGKFKILLLSDFVLTILDIVSQSICSISSLKSITITI